MATYTVEPQNYGPHSTDYSVNRMLNLNSYLVNIIKISIKRVSSLEYVDFTLSLDKYRIAGNFGESFANILVN